MGSIKDGSNGKVAGVDDKNRLRTFSVIQNQDKDSNVGGRQWSIYLTVTPTAANDKFFYLENSGTKDLFITDIRISSTVPTQIFYRWVTGTASAGTDAEVTSRNLGSSAVPNAIIQYDVDFTGLVDAGVLFFEEAAVADTRYNLKTTSNIIIPQGKAVAFERVEATGLIECVVSLTEAE